MCAARLETVDIVLALDSSEDREVWRTEAARALKIDAKRISEVRLRKHSIDARKGRIRVQLRVDAVVDGKLPPETAPVASYPAVPVSSNRVIIVGSGPAGLFAALRAIELGWRPVVLERGKDVSARRFDLAPLLREGRVIEDSNYCFGEGGAGTFSDGKLYTRAKKRGPVQTVYETFVAHGAPERILVDAHPHIGSNLLPNVVKAMRESILGAGGEVHFNTKISELIVTNDRCHGARSADGREFVGHALILATGHSARDIYLQLVAQNIRLEQKPFALGVRVEHSQEFVDSRQYHTPKGTRRHDLLPAASYSLATKIEDRGVFSFCMCPGGFIVPAATENDEIVVNGMSLSRRDSPFANSGMVVTVEPGDTGPWVAEHGVLAGVAFQKEMERAAKTSGGGGQVAPAQRMNDFMSGRLSKDLPSTSYHPGISSARIDALLPEWIRFRLRLGLKLFGRKMPGYLTNDAILVGFESRTSSPVRIPRDPETLQHPDVAGLFPCGEGAGFAGGIVSAALDGMRCAEALSGLPKSH